MCGSEASHLDAFHQPTRSHVKPIYLAGGVVGGGGGELFSSSCAVVREVHGGSEMFVFVLLAEFFLCVGVFTVSRSTSGMHFNRWRF